MELNVEKLGSGCTSQLLEMEKCYNKATDVADKKLHQEAGEDHKNERLLETEKAFLNHPQ